MRRLVFLFAFFMLILNSSVVSADTATNDLIASISNIQWVSWSSSEPLPASFSLSLPHTWKSSHGTKHVLFSPTDTTGDVGCLLFLPPSGEVVTPDTALALTQGLLLNWEETTRQELVLDSGQPATLIKGRGRFKSNSQGNILILITQTQNSSIIIIAGAQTRYYYPYEPTFLHIMRSFHAN